MSALRSSPNGIGFETSRGGAIARASASTAFAWRRTPALGSGPPGSSTTKALSPGKLWFCQETAVPW